jgi:hypothetical protein
MIRREAKGVTLYIRFRMTGTLRISVTAHILNGNAASPIGANRYTYIGADLRVSCLLRNSLTWTFDDRAACTGTV